MLKPVSSCDDKLEVIPIFFPEGMKGFFAAF